MSHGDTINPIGFWSLPMVPEASDYQRFDMAQTKILNGDAGGTWSPTSPIGIGGAGLALTTAGSGITSGATTYRGGRLVLGANDFVALAPTRARTIVLPLTWMQLQSTAMRSTDLVATISAAPNPVGLVPTINAGAINFVIPPRFLHGGATLLSASLSFHPSPSGVAGAAFVLTGAKPDGTSVQVFTPNQATTWIASHAYVIGNYVKPTATNQTGFYYKCTTAGTTGATEPAWPTTIGNTVVDGGVTWVCVGNNGTLSQQTIGRIGLYTSVALTSTFLQDPSFALTVDPTTYVYQLSILADGGTILHALTLNFGNISTNAFE